MSLRSIARDWLKRGTRTKRCLMVGRRLLLAAVGVWMNAVVSTMFIGREIARRCGRPWT